ncbi:MAG: hypothetical protein JXA52_04095 [Planctomycetes bacterium]|nr:hypothetical protein [Planctomycetota bacterium]
MAEPKQPIKQTIRKREGVMGINIIGFILIVLGIVIVGLELSGISYHAMLLIGAAFNTAWILLGCGTILLASAAIAKAIASKKA